VIIRPFLAPRRGAGPVRVYDDGNETSVQTVIVCWY